MVRAKPALRFFAPEVVQTSAMDCGPASLKCLLEGFGIQVSYGRLREACQTDVDGTSLNTVEDIALQLGLQVAQVMIPVDHLFLRSTQTLPALVVVKLPMGHPHFLVVWRTLGQWVQVMDPGKGRQWMTQAHFLKQLYQHQVVIEATAWRAWAGTGLRTPLRERLAKVGVTAETSEQLLDQATASDGWFTLALLDAATRLVSVVVDAGGVQRGLPATHLLTTLMAQAEQVAESKPTDTPPFAPEQVIPGNFWSVRPAAIEVPDNNGEAEATAPADETPAADPKEAATVQFSGAVLLQVLGRATPRQDTHTTTGEEAEAAPAAQPNLPLSPDLIAALQEAPARPAWAIWQSLRADGLVAPIVLLLGAALATAGVIIEATLLRSLLKLAGQSTLTQEPLAFLVRYVLFVLLLALLELPLSLSIGGLGRKIETRLRIALLEKLPQLGDRYFHSRLISDMAQRAYGLRQLRDLPGLAVQLYRVFFQLLLTAGGIGWLAPNCAPLALLAVAWSIGCSLLGQWLLSEQDNKMLSHAAALTRFTLDGLMGLIPLRTHVAERALRREQEEILTHWLAATTTLNRMNGWVQVLESLGSNALIVALVITYLRSGGEASGMLLLLYWAINLSTLGQSLTAAGLQYPAQRNQVLRLLEPLSTPSEDELSAALTPVDPSPPGAKAFIHLEDVTVLAGGHPILQEVNLAIPAGSHVAIVGPSGAGKSSLVGLLLGWHRPASGRLWIDGAALTGERLLALRQQTAWVDPAIQIWNRSLFENLHYGASQVTDQAFAGALEKADLYGVLERLPNGLQTPLGEGGGLVSGGEGQRVRLGRALARPGVRLVILDEPFRGLDRAKRQQLLAEARHHWRDATLICITHDVGETQAFDRVLVVENSHIVEDAAPGLLAADPTTRYHALLQAEENVRQAMWQGEHWRRLRMEEGVVW